jgi:site-specific DNA-methyltransferase (adenine-specific)/modification methylase
VTPYWQSDDGAIRVYHARTGDAGPAYAHLPDVLVELAEELRGVALVHADPPYGQGEQTNRHTKGRGINPWFKGGANAKARDFAPVVGDDRAYDPAPLLALERPLVTWGAQRYAERLPASPSWLWWDKREDVLPDDNGDGELAWSNLGGPPRQLHHLWKGSCRSSETGTPHLHPTQKPIALCSWVYQHAKLRPGDLVFVPYLGSGPDLPACRAAGLRCIAVEVVRDYCDTAIARLGAVTRERMAEPVGPLFAGRRNA